MYESKTEKNPTLDIAIPLSCIERITLSPWVPRALSRHVKRTLKSITGCSNLEIARSTLIGNEEWKKLGGVCNPQTQYGSKGQGRRAPVTAGTGEKEQPLRGAWRADAFLALPPHPTSHLDGPGRPETVECPRSFIPPHPDSRTAAMTAPVNVRSLSVMAVPSPLDAVRFRPTPFSPRRDASR